jgi:phage/plasmid-associated DNA primase
MNIIEFLNDTQLRFLPIYYEVINNKKKQIKEMNNLLEDEIDNRMNYIKSNFKLEEHPVIYLDWRTKDYLIAEYMEYYEKVYSIYLKYSYCYVIDIDDENINHINQLNKKYDVIKNSAWCKGNTKGIHIYVLCENCPEYTKQIDVLNDYKGDFLNKNNVWEKIDKLVYGEIKWIDFNELKTILNIDKMNIIKEEDVKQQKQEQNNEKLEHIIENLYNETEKELYNLLVDIINKLNINRADDYELWRNVGFSLKSFEFETVDIWLLFSQRNKNKYNKNECLKVWKTFKSEGRIYNFFSLLKWLREDDEKEYHNIYKNYKNLIEKEEFYKQKPKMVDFFINNHFLSVKSILNTKEHIIYIFDKKLNIYKKINIDELISEMYIFLCEFFENFNQIEDYAQYIEDYYLSSVAKQIKYKTKDNDFIYKLDTNREVLNFKNGILNLKTGEFRERTVLDFYSIYEDYDYNPIINENITKDIYNDFLKICNDDNDLLDDYLNFFGCAITGEMNYDFSNLIQIGAGSNGKSTMSSIMYSYVLNKYTYMTSASSFDCNNGNDKSKFTEGCFNKKTRLCFVEEMNDNLFDVAFFKRLTGSEVYTGPVLHKAEQATYNIYAKYIFLTNRFPNFNTSNAENLSRRFGLFEHKKEFKTDEEIKKRKDKGENIDKYYIKNPDMINKYKNDDYKNALINILLEYSKKFYNNNKKLLYKTNINERFNIANEENDVYAEYFKSRTIYTKQENNNIGKQQLYNDFIMFYQRKLNVSFKDFFKNIKDFKSIFYNSYNKDIMRDNVRGIYTGISFIEEKDSKKFDY